MSRWLVVVSCSHEWAESNHDGHVFWHCTQCGMVEIPESAYPDVDSLEFTDDYDDRGFESPIGG